MNWSAFTFLGCMAFFVGHEIDATYRKEWCLLPLLRTMKDETAAAWFIALHVPVAFFLLAVIALLYAVLLSSLAMYSVLSQ